MLQYKEFTQLKKQNKLQVTNNVLGKHVQPKQLHVSGMVDFSIP